MTRARTARSIDRTPSPTSMQVANGRSGGSTGSGGSSGGRRRHYGNNRRAANPGHHGPGSRAAAEAAAVSTPMSASGEVVATGEGASGGRDEVRSRGRNNRRAKHRIPFPPGHRRDGYGEDASTKNTSDIVDSPEMRFHYLQIIIWSFIRSLEASLYEMIRDLISTPKIYLTLDHVFIITKGSGTKKR